jgi:hypothetical protein
MRVGDLVMNNQNLVGLVLRIIPDPTYLYVKVAWCDGRVAIELDHQIGLLHESR